MSPGRQRPLRPGGPCPPGREAALAALQALYDAADDDSAIGGPDLTRRIFPILAVITEAGFDRLTEAEELSRELVEQRHRKRDGPVASP
ncbi:Proteasome subunit beta 2 [Streptomyces leeuwenhoekii]|uniref:Proteasome subunit beta 2 n=1 Tax=Streptomyces leeuwenhoekii TaxID=1437453 RepID=A0A0F7VR29_STRLW|nr:Proteasome subunit beta 2 [Streptomyces leeuwenhoekii]